METLANGSWLSRDRVVRIALISLCVSLLSLCYLFATARGTLDSFGRPLGTDFSQVWTAGRMVLDGRAAEVWSWPEHFRVQQIFHGSSDVPVYGWHYPPPFLLVATLLGTLPYLVALFVWQAATLLGFTLLMWRMVPRRETLLLVAAAPVTLICLTHGHNGFLTALLLGGGLWLLERRPVVAGILLGCLVYKPQFALIIPPLLLVTRNWRAIGGAALSSLSLIALTFAFWGWPVWQAFIDSLSITRGIVIEQGNTGWYKIMSGFAAVRMWGGSVPLAYAVQTVISAAAVIAVIALSLQPNRNLRNAAVAAAVLVSTPYVMDYDYVVLGLGLAFLWLDGEDQGFLAWDRTLLAVAWIAPLAGRQVAQFTLVPLVFATALIALAISLRRFAVRASPFRRSRAAFGR